MFKHAAGRGEAIGKPTCRAEPTACGKVSLQSRVGLNAANFFLAEITGGVIGPLGAGFLAEHLGYNGFFYVFAGIATVAAGLFLTLMPETGGNHNAGSLVKEGNRP